MRRPDGRPQWFGPLGDRIVTTVTVDGHAPLRTVVAPCWTITESNGRCCGYEYTAASTIAPYGD